MRRLLVIAVALVAAGLLIALPAIGADDGPYKIRAVFDNGGFIVNGEEVRVAGARVGQVDSVDVSDEDEIVSLEGGEHAVPGKAVVVLAIEDDGFKDFREDASCTIRPQSLIGEKFVDCTPTNPRAPGSEPPPELEQIPDGEPGEGQRLLPLENNGTSVDLDLVQNIQRAPYRDRFRLILNDLGAGLAARGDDLAAIVERANPALRQTDRVLNILAQQNQALASLASNGDQVLEPLARERASVSGFINNANLSAQAAAERRDDLEAGLQRFPRFLRELRATMRDLRYFGDQGGPLFEDIGVAAPHISKATQKLGPFATAAIPAFVTLGDAAESAGPKLVGADPLLAELASFADGAVPVGNNLSALLDSFYRTNGFQYLTEFIYNAAGNTNGFDSFGHFQRAQVSVNNCLEVAVDVPQGCETDFQVDQPTAQTQPKKKGKKSSGGFSAPQSAAPSPPQESQPPPTIEELIPELEPILPEQPSDEGDGGGEGDQVPEDGSTAPDAAAVRALGGATATPGTPAQVDEMSLREATMLLDLLLGAGV